MDIETYRHPLPDTELFVQRAGTADQTILLIHGFLASSFSWRLLIPLLSPHFTVYAIDLPGFGRSDKGRRYPYTLSAYARSLQAFIQAEGLAPLTLMAHSMGGQVALRLAALVPGAVEQLILIAPSGYLPPAKRWQKFALRLPGLHRVVPLLLTERRIQQQLVSVYYQRDHVNNPTIRDGYISPLKERDFPRALLQFARSREGDLSSEDLHKITQPILLLWGRHDRIVPLRVGQRLNRDLPHSRLEVIEGTGHVPMEEKPHAVWQHTASFLRIPTP